ncbi:hypothetical protein LHJ74_11025 [Streptomyces sp. N2-109]|uniref:Integral membrane protein n=1 Tax=Streptomyces gossypii TaxID=2883101 RepID=A0ABT2JRD1_9ACTN|nr:hypothetical protein [Streptomyces gossypii]MCT2590435.1 hypothetical protein [Streptomyces gossypii]
MAIGVLLARWLGRVAADRLTANGPELLLLMRTGRANRPGTTAGVGTRPKPELTKREQVVSALAWIFGSLALFPQGLVPLLFLITDAPVKAWVLSLYLPQAWSWAVIAVMISIGTVLYTQAIRLSSGKASRRTPQASPETGGEVAGLPDSGRKERESV